MREAMFDKATPGRNLLNTNCTIYQEINKIAGVMRTNEPLRFGRMYFRQISGDGEHFGFPFGSTYTLAFSPILYLTRSWWLTTWKTMTATTALIMDSILHPDGSSMRFLYGSTGTIPVRTAKDGSRFVKLDLKPHEFVILG